MDGSTPIIGDSELFLEGDITLGEEADPGPIGADPEAADLQVGVTAMVDESSHVPLPFSIDAGVDESITPLPGDSLTYHEEICLF